MNNQNTPQRGRPRNPGSTRGNSQAATRPARRTYRGVQIPSIINDLIVEGTRHVNDINDELPTITSARQPPRLVNSGATAA